MVKLDLFVLHGAGLFQEGSFVNLSTSEKSDAYFADARSEIQKLITKYDGDLKFDSCKMASVKLTEYQIGLRGDWRVPYAALSLMRRGVSLRTRRCLC